MNTLNPGCCYQILWHDQVHNFHVDHLVILHNCIFASVLSRHDILEPVRLVCLYVLGNGIWKRSAIRHHFIAHFTEPSAIAWNVLPIQRNVTRVGWYIVINTGRELRCFSLYTCLNQSSIKLICCAAWIHTTSGFSNTAASVSLPGRIPCNVVYGSVNRAG